MLSPKKEGHQWQAVSRYWQSFTAAGLSGSYTRFPFNPEGEKLSGTYLRCKSNTYYLYRT